MNFTSETFDFLMPDGTSINTMIVLPYLDEDETESNKTKLIRLAALEKKIHKENDPLLSNRSF